MATKKIIRCDFWLRPYGNTEEARAMCHLDARTPMNDTIWAELTKRVSPKMCGWKYQELYDELDKLNWLFKDRKK